MAYYTADFSGSTSAHLSLEVTTNWTDAATNRSAIHYRFCLYSNGYAFRNYHDCVWSLSVHGTQVGGATNADYNLNSGTVIVLCEGDRLINHDASGGATIPISAAYNGRSPIGTSSLNVTYVISTAILPPYSATDVVATRITDTQIKLTWSNPSDAQHPYVSSNIDRWDSASGQWRGLINASGTSYTDNTTQADRDYRYNIWQTNGAGSAASEATSNTVCTTPLAPTNAQITKVGSTIKVTWTDIATVEVGYQIECASGGVWQTAGQTGANTIAFTHMTPPGGLIQYRVRAIGSTGLVSEWVLSNEITFSAPPAAPTNLRPAGGMYVDRGQPIVLRWQYNSGDTTTQTVYELRYRVNGGSWVNVSGGADASRQLVANTFSDGANVEWQVRTKGGHPDWSSWSAIESFIASVAPVISGLSPDGTWVNDRLRVSWSYTDANHISQVSAAIVFTPNGGEPWSTIVGGTATTFERQNFRLKNGDTFSLSLVATNGRGINSNTLISQVTVDFREPPKPNVAIFFDESNGSVSLGITNPIPTADQEQTVHNEIWYSDDPELGRLIVEQQKLASGSPVFMVMQNDIDARFAATAVSLSDNISVNGAFVDPIPSISNAVYRVLAVSALETSTWSDVLPLNAQTHWAYLNGGNGFGICCRWRADLVSSQVDHRDKVLYQFSGATYPVEFSGVSKSFVLSIGGILEPESGYSSPQELAMLLDCVAPLLYRDPWGRREKVSVAEVSLTDLQDRGAHISFTATATRIMA